ncbi:MAG: hypothetical protein FJ191_11230 [Gammaproteobacteria bacterium]|nr:hypothetical protein [Gammaproteobacteria bacterium]
MARRSSRPELLRQALAREAARLMIEHGIDDYGFAKRKAAQRLGAGDRAVLPTNVEIETALAEHQRLFGPATHARELAAMRVAALQAMRVLAGFRPRLVGSLLAGTATPHSEIELHVFADTPEKVTVELLDRGIHYQVAERRLRYQRDAVTICPALRFAAGGYTVEAVIFPVDGIRQAPLGPVDGRPLRRATPDELAALVDSAPAAGSD